MEKLKRKKKGETKMDIDSVLQNKSKKEYNKEEYKAYKKEEKCLNCGACIDICPVGINPLLLKEKNYKEK